MGARRRGRFLGIYVMTSSSGMLRREIARRSPRNNRDTQLDEVVCARGRAKRVDRGCTVLAAATMRLLGLTPDDQTAWHGGLAGDYRRHRGPCSVWCTA